MGLAQRIAELASRLPASQQAEVLDFVEFLSSKAAKPNAAPEGWDEAAFSALSAEGVVDEEDPITYDLSDCREVR